MSLTLPQRSQPSLNTVTYMRLLDADQQGAEAHVRDCMLTGVMSVGSYCGSIQTPKAAVPKWPSLEPSARAGWMTEEGYRHLLKAAG